MTPSSHLVKWQKLMDLIRCNINYIQDSIFKATLSNHFIFTFMTLHHTLGYNKSSEVVQKLAELWALNGNIAKNTFFQQSQMDATHKDDILWVIIIISIPSTSNFVKIERGHMKFFVDSNDPYTLTPSASLLHVYTLSSLGLTRFALELASHI